MTTNSLCPKCQNSLPSDAPGGLCPSCLLAAAFPRPELDASPDRFLSPTTPGTARFVPPSAAALAPLFPQLEILGLLGHGGMGAVYKARQKKLDRLVALKIIRPEAAADPAFAERFNREARTLARLSHPHIVAVHDFGEVSADDGKTAAGSAPVFYFLMEYVDGANLRQLMDGRRLPSDQALAIVPQVCEALQFAHDEGVVHRDIKPENILIDSRGRVKIADFGLAKLVVGSADEFTLTGTHQIMGTPRYMAPEQMEGSHAVDHRADIYSLGVVFYEMLTGQVPAGHFDPPSKKADSDPKLDAIVLRAMAREPERRFQQASHLGSEIARAQIGNGIATGGVSFSSVEDAEATAGSLALSSFLSREARAAYHWVAGSDNQSSKNTTGPRLLMLLLSLIPCAMVFFPWFDVYITDPDATRGLEATQIVQYKNGTAFYRQFSPLELPAGMLFGVAVCMLIVSSGIAFGRRVSTVTAACTGLVLCSVPLALTMVLRVNMEYSLVTVFADPVTDEMPQGVLSHINGVGTATLEWLEHTVQYRLPFVVTVGCLFLLLCMQGIELRYAMERRSRQLRDPKASSPLTDLAWWLTVGAGILAFSAAATSVYFLDDPYVFDSTIRSSSEVITAVIAMSGQFLCFPIFVLTLLAASSLRHGHHGKLATAACVAFFVPVTPGWFLMMPIGAWGLSVLYRQNRGFLWSSGTMAEPVVKKVRAASTPVDRVAAWLRRAAVVLAGSAVVTLVVLIGIIDAPFRAYRGDDEVLMTLCAAQVFCFPLAVAAFVAAGGITERRLRTLALIVSGLFLLPLSPAWLMTLPVGAWSLSVLSRKEIAAAFQENVDSVALDATASRPPFPWGDFAFGLVVMLSVMGLIFFAQVWTDSAWVLCSTFPVWFGIGYLAGEESKKKTSNGAADWIAGIALPLTLGLIAYGIYQTNNAWPLVYLMAAIAGAGAGYGAATDNDSDEITTEESEVATKENTGSAVAPIDVVDTEQRGTDNSSHVSDSSIAVPRQQEAAQSVRRAEQGPLRKAWNEFWAGRNLWLTKVVQSILGLAFVLAFFLFISFSTRSTVVYPTPGGPGVRATFVSFGTPSPWFELSQNAGGTTGYGFQWRILWYSSANVVMLLGLLAYWITYQIEKAKPDFKSSRFGSPTAVTLMVGAVAVLCILVGHLPLLMPEWKQTLVGDARTPLLIAVEKGNGEEVQSLLNDGADPNQQLQKGLNSPLWWAVANGDSEIFEALITAQASVNFKNEFGVTPLMLASACGDISLVGALLSEGAQVNAQDTVTIDTFSVSARTGEIPWPGQRLTPLMLAANSGYRDVVEMLLQAGADASLRNAAGQAAAEMALSRNYRDVHHQILGSMRPAIEKPPGDINAEVQPATEASLHAAIAADDVDRVKQWLNLGSPINQRDATGRTPLELAIIAGRERIVAFLVLKGADTLQRDAQGKTPLLLAIENQQAPVVRMLLDMERLSYDKEFQFRMTRIDSDLKPDADFSVMRFDSGIDTADSDGVTPDMKAAALGHSSIFQMIAMQHLCDDFDTMGRSWISHAIENRREAFLVEMFDGVNSQIPQLPPNHGSGSRITPELLAHADASARLPLAYARELGLTAVAEQIEKFCRLTIEKCDRDLAASPDYADYNNKTRELCLKAMKPSI